MKRSKLEVLGILGVVSFFSYLSMVVISPYFYPGYNSMAMAVSELSALSSPSKAIADQLNALFGPCALISITAVWVSISKEKPRSFRIGISLFLAMEWICDVGYSLFPWVSGESNLYFQNLMHLTVTASVVILSLSSLVVLSLSSKKAGLGSLGIFASITLFLMMLGPIGTALLPQSVFGLFERFSTFSTVIFNGILGLYLFMGKFTQQEGQQKVTKG